MGAGFECDIIIIMEKDLEKNEEMMQAEGAYVAKKAVDGNEVEVEEPELDERVVDQGVAEWQAKEYIVEKRNTGWYLAVLAVGVVLVAVAIFLKYWTFAALTVVSVLTLFVYVKRPAQEVKYRLDRDGLWENEKRLRKYGDFKAFSVVQENNNFSIVLTPKKRFGLQVRVYFPQDQGEKIVDMFGVKLPMKELKMDFLDKLVKFLRI